MENFSKITAVLAVLVINTFLGGFVFMKLWNWLIIPVWEVGSIRFVESLAVLSVLDFIIHRFHKPKEVEGQTFSEKLLVVTIENLTYCGFSLLFGWIISTFL
jgi:hypothetical protein